jgi:hypothetical protein
MEESRKMVCHVTIKIGSGSKRGEPHFPVWHKNKVKDSLITTRYAYIINMWRTIRQTEV